jgi:hypothetical protein
MEHKSEELLKLPLLAATKVDIGRLVREIGAISEFLDQAAIRHPGASVKMPKTSRLMDEMIAVNKLNLLVAADRQRLEAFLKDVREHAPVLHMSFNADPAPLFMSKLMTWLREHIHPFVLLQVGLQPNIGAGCILRTTNKQFDLSLRQHFDRQGSLLLSKLRGDMPAPAPARPEPSVATAAAGAAQEGADGHQ